MKFSINALLIVLAATLLTSCTTTGVTSPNAAVVSRLAAVRQRHLATMVIYRPRNSFGGWVSATVLFDGKELVNMDNGRVFVFAVQPGRHVIEMDNKRSGTEVNFKANSSVYLKVEMVAGTWHGSGKLIQVASEQGEFESKRLELGSPEDIENPSFRQP